MIELEKRLRDGLDLLIPLPSAASASWEDALRRGETMHAPSSPPTFRSSRSRRRVTALALSVTVIAGLAFSPVGGAIARGVSDFSAWLTGNPGEPASEGEQRAFNEANERSWEKFPDSPKLRRVIVAEAAGGTFALYGFRSGDSLCLRLTVTGIPADEKDGTGCTPLAELRQADAPAVITLVDYPFGREDIPPNDEGLIPARASATFGVVADGVSGVAVTTNAGEETAIVRSNVFLAVTSHPQLGLRTKKLTVVTDDGQRIAVALAESPYGNYGPATTPGIAPGPTQLERRVEGGTIGWLLRREPRGLSLEEAGLAGRRLFPTLPGRQSEVRFARVIKPDPKGLRRVVIAVVDFGRNPSLPLQLDGEQLCTGTITPGLGAGAACSPLVAYFRRDPFSVGVGAGHGGDQYVTVQGLASDDVTRMELFLGSGERVEAPLEDNVYLTSISRLDFPIRLVAYDANDRIIGIESFAHDPLASPGPRPIEGKQRVVRRVPAADGSVATLRLGPSTAGTTCWQISFRDGHGGSGCQQKRYRGPALSLYVDTSGILMGTVSPRVVAVGLLFENGAKDIVEPIDGIVLYALPDRRPVTAVGLDRSGREVARKRFEPPNPSNNPFTLSTHRDHVQP